MREKNEAEAMAYIVCEMESKPTSCDSCPGRKGGCFTIPKMQKLIENGYGKLETVKTGKWIDVPLNMDPEDFAYKYNLRTKCSVCGFAMPREYPRYNICPNCGAKMIH